MNPDRIHYWLGFLEGTIKAITLRHDVPLDVRESALKAIESYRLESQNDKTRK